MKMAGEDTNNILRIVIGLIVLLLVAAIIFIIYRVGKSGVNSSLGKVQKMNEQLDTSQYTDYDGQVVNGSTVQSLLSNWKGGTVTLTVDTMDIDGEKGKNSGTTGNYYLANSNGTYTDNSAALQISNPDGGNYVSPSAKYLVTVIKRKNSNDIREVKFTLQ